MSDIERPSETEPFLGRVRLVDVATRSGVTKSIASRILNNDLTLSVRLDTRQRVVKAARDLGYRPHAGARALARSEARALALLIPDLSNPVYSRIVRGAYRQAQRRGYVVLLAEDTEENDVDEAFIELVESGRVDGLLIASARPEHPFLSSPRLAHIPHVFVNREMSGSGRNVLMDLAAASTCAVNYLFELGHRHIGQVSGPFDLGPAKAREEGFRLAARSLGIDATLIQRDAFTEKGGSEAIQRLLRLHPEMTAVCTSTLNQAVGALHGARVLGRHIPEDLSIITYDDLPLADYLDPPLSTVAMPLIDLGAAAVDAVIDQLQGRAPKDVVVPTIPQIVERHSTRPIDRVVEVFAFTEVNSFNETTPH